MTMIKLSPTGLTFLWDDCKRSYPFKVMNKLTRPSTPMKAIFIKIDGLMKDYFEGRSTAGITPDLPPGIIQSGDKSVYPRSIKLPDHSFVV